MVSTEIGIVRGDRRTDGSLLRIASTKTIPPLMNRTRIERGRLLDSLDEASSRRLILIKAPAGYGKTTLAVDWREHLRQSGAITAWLSLDESDNEPGAYAYHLSSAIYRAAPEIGRTAIDLVSAAKLVDPKHILSSAINAISESDDEIYAFLDDYHAVTDQRVHDLSAYLLRYAPANFHLVITSRIEPPLPISRYRLADEIAEVEMRSLRFTLAETDQFFAADVIPSLAAGEIRRLYEATEGWPAALQLARIALRNSPDPAGTISSLTGASRQISAYIQDTLATQADEIVDFLLKTAILDRLNGALCHAVTGIARSAELLKALDHERFLLVALDDNGGWYRYHHLMGEYLLDRVRLRMPELLPDLHRRAYAWYAEAKLWRQAVHHALAANDMEEASKFVRQCAMELIDGGDLVTLLAWDRQLPQRLTRGHVEVKLALAWGMALVTRFAEAQELFEQVEQQVGQDEVLIARCRFGQIVLCALRDDSAGALRILQKYPAPPAFADSLQGRNVARFAYWKRGDWEAFDAVPGLDPSAEVSANVQLETHRLNILGMVACQKLEFDGARTFFAEARAVVRRHLSEKSIVEAMITGPDALLSYERGDVGTAEVVVLDELPIIETTAYHESFLRAYTVLVRAAALRTDYSRALKLVDRAERLAAERGWYRVVAVFVLKRVRLFLRDGRLDDARAAVVRIRKIAVDHPVTERCSWSEIHTCLATAEGLVALALEDHVVAASKLDEAFQELLAIEDRYGALRVGLDLAKAHMRLEETDRALDVLRRILGWAARAGAVSFLRERGEEFVQLLAWARRSPSIGADADVAALIDLIVADSTPGREMLRKDDAGAQAARKLLSARERSIIEFIAGGQSNKQIARTLGVTPETIKTHVKRIFVKLSAESRAQAVVRAQSLGLLRNVEVN